jgi:hypothetical protein
MSDINYISDELLAAFLDGNTNEAETRQVLQALKSDPALRETLDIALNLDSERHVVLPMMQMAARSGENLCSVMCQAYVLNRRGISYDEDSMLAIARQKHWLRPEGSPLHAMGQLLAHHGLMVTHRYDATLADITAALERDNDIIVAINNDRLHTGNAAGNDAADHAVVVTAIDNERQEVTIYNPENNKLQEVAMDRFSLAWQASLNYMVRVLQEAGEYEPQPINLDNVELTDILLELREAIAENAHDVWAAARFKDGWTYGPERNDSLKHNPDLLPYCALPDAEKEYDRMMALDTIKLVKKLGFDIIKR